MTELAALRRKLRDVEMEWDILKKSSRHIFKNDRERFGFIDENHPVFPLGKMCRALEVSRSGYYAFKKRPKSQRRLDNDKLLIEIKRVFVENQENYGRPRIWNQLNNLQGIRCSENRVAKVMREAGVVAVQKRKFRLTTNSKYDHPVWPNILERNFTVDRPNAVWVSDITYIWTWEGWLYLAAVLDLFSRGVVRLAMDKTIADTLVTQAMK